MYLERRYQFSRASLELTKTPVQNAPFAALERQLVPQKCSQNLMPTLKLCLIHSWY